MIENGLRRLTCYFLIFPKLYKSKSHNISINVAKIGIKIPCLEHGSYSADKDVTCSLYTDYF
jgi:hypothetical protein